MKIKTSSMTLLCNKFNLIDKILLLAWSVMIVTVSIMLPYAEATGNAMQNIGIGLFTTLISVVLLMYGDQKVSSFTWDTAVIIDRVIEARSLFCSFALIFTPFLLITDGKAWVQKSFLLSFYFVGIVYTVKILINSYRWIRTLEISGEHDSQNYRMKHRINYLESIGDINEKERVWIIAWKQKDMHVLLERNLMKSFIIHMDNLLKKEEISAFSSNLRNFSDFSEHRSLQDWNIFGQLQPKILEWHYAFWTKDHANKEIFLAKYNLERLLKTLFLHSLQGDTSYIFFTDFKKHIETNTDDRYVQNLFARIICLNFFENIAKSSDKQDIWAEYFPASWKITKDTMQDPRNKVSKVWRNKFLNWAQTRLFNGGLEIDEDLDETNRELFPETSPILWARIIAFVLGHWVNENRIKSAVERTINFGMTGRLISTGSHDESNTTTLFNAIEHKLEEQDSKTIELAMILFPSVFSKELLESYIRELEGMQNLPNPDNEKSRLSYLRIFKHMLETLNAAKI